MSDPGDFDFLAWSRLANADPAGFEAARRKVVEAMIVIGENPEQLRRLQWRLDAERRRARTPMKACLRISSLMWEAFLEFQATLNRAVGYEMECRDAPRHREARVLRLDKTTESNR